uniref:Uncharacterized protein n=1 Tax=Amphimedon queenslandica TaxID=400682 RepID=A0A1X7TBW0_AMPQE
MYALWLKTISLEDHSLGYKRRTDQSIRSHPDSGTYRTLHLFKGL